MRWLAPLLLLLALRVPAAWSQEPEPEAPADEAPPPPTMDFSAYDSAISAGKKASAADALLVILDDPAQRALHATAWIKLAELMEGYGFEVAATHCWAEAIRADVLVASPKLAHAIDLAEKVGDEGRLGAVFAENMGAQVDPSTRSRMAFLAARELLRRDELGAAAGLLPMVDKSSEVYLDAELLRGVVLSLQGRHEDAVSPMLAAQAIARTEGRGQRFDEVVALNVARSYYGAQDWTRAIAWFDKLPRSSPYWPEATFEKAWAYFRAEDMPGTLAQLLNHGSPFFDDWFFPEADLLRAYAEFLMCKFSDATESMDGFVARYTPLKEELDRILPTLDPERGWADGVAVKQGGSTTLPASVLRPFVLEERFARSMEVVEAADRELERLGALDGHPIGERVRGWVEERRATIVRTEGQRVLDRGRWAQQELTEMLQGIELTRLDLLNLEAEMFQRASVTGELDFGDKIGKLRDLRKTKKRTHRVWPFEGEFWADELGWYVIDARPDCPEAMARGDEG